MVWGETTGYRIAHHDSDLPEEMAINNYPRTSGISRPFKVGPITRYDSGIPQGGDSDPIRKIYMGGRIEGALRLATSHLKVQGLPQPGRGRTTYIRPQIVGPRIVSTPIPHRVPIAIAAREPSLDKDDMEVDPQVLQASFGRYIILAIDRDNRLLIGSIPPTGPVTYRSKLLPDAMSGTILRVVAGWGSFCALTIANRGLILFEDDGSSGGFIEKWHVISGPDNKQVVDFVVGEDFVVYLDSAGELFAVDLKVLPYLSTIQLTNIQDTFHKLTSKITNLDILSNPPRIVRVNGWFRRFVAYDDYGHVVIAERTNSDISDRSKSQFEPTVYEGLQNNSCTAVAFGDHHIMALVGGKIMVWGAESKGCGCFGLGNSDQVLQLEGSSRDRGGLHLKNPTVVPTDGLVVAIAAGGWQSSALIVDGPPPV
ncbi:SCF ubiquitin ligase complex subunit SAF1 [Sugiyamaella lignohabitans]|uniref:SCF ubiquitin ligase complex subunit SAF1 n=1 Tax=Sugiyamaella lignohabitans TaxID=796027 RepID=A0A161HHA9_9ASCO|nr:SCF ubiquitin ligase complex subunit SAF1 [Sugiyamaella lignohabitans]ANB15360.1 SCF ubiquitin ligase complex subunit SAF1 [Sugiyamaella lignohabitans]